MKPLERTPEEIAAELARWDGIERRNAERRVENIVRMWRFNRRHIDRRAPGTYFRPMGIHVTHPFQVAPQPAPKFTTLDVFYSWANLGATCMGFGLCFCGFWVAFHYPTITACSVVGLGAIVGLYWLAVRAWRSQ